MCNQLLPLAGRSTAFLTFYLQLVYNLLHTLDSSGHLLDLGTLRRRINISR